MAAAQHLLVRAHPYSRDAQLLACANTVHLLQQGDGYLRAPSPSWTHACAQQAKCTTEFMARISQPQVPDQRFTDMHTHARMHVVPPRRRIHKRPPGPSEHCTLFRMSNVCPPNHPPECPAVAAAQPATIRSFPLPCASTLYLPVIPSTNAPTPSIHPTT